MLQNKKIILVALFILGGTIGFINLEADLSEDKKLSDHLTILDRHGREVRHIKKGETQKSLHLDEVPKEVLELLVLAEDKRFFEHSGLDIFSSYRAFISNLKRGKVVSGASTISQQVIRLRYNIPRSFLNKIIVILKAMKLEVMNSKAQILKYYINHVPYGKNILGVNLASEYFFGKKLKALSLAEKAVLAVLPRSPSYLLSLKGRVQLIRLRDSLLHRYKKEALDKSNLVELALKEDLATYKVSNPFIAPHFVNKILKNKNLVKYVDENGKVKTTLDLDLQKEVVHIMKAQIRKLQGKEVSKAAVIVLDSRNGEILAYSGSQDFFGAQGGQIDSVETPRQPGSSVKPFTYALALENGFHSSTVLPDVKHSFVSGAGTYIPRNYSKEYSGPRLFSDSLANSLNIPSLYLVDKLGYEQVYRFYNELGLELTEEPDHYGVGITLGNGETSLLKLARAYTIFTTGGSLLNLKSFYSDKNLELKRLISTEVSFLIGDILDDDYLRRGSFGSQNIFELDHSLSVKTGTSTRFRDNWAFGFNPKYIIGVWVGNTNQTPMSHVSGISGAGPILTKISNYLSKDKFIGKFNKPLGIVEKEVCSDSGMRVGSYCSDKKTRKFFSPHFPTKVCSYHKEMILRGCFEEKDKVSINILELPEVFNEWLRTNHKAKTVSDQIHNYCSREDVSWKRKRSTDEEDIRIKSPTNGAIYAIDPNIPKDHQILRIEAETFSEFDEIIWMVDGVEVQKGNQDFYDLVLSKGKPKINVNLLKKGKVMAKDKVSINVL